jgi:tetratricopeptide (TPR) repeat protein
MGSRFVGRWRFNLALHKISLFRRQVRRQATLATAVQITLGLVSVGLLFRKRKSPAEILAHDIGVYRDLSNLAQSLTERGNATDAAKAFFLAVETCRTVVVRDPGRRQDLASLLRGLGFARSGETNLEGSLAAYNESEAIFRDLASADSKYLTDLAGVLSKSGAVLEKQGQFKQAAEKISESASMYRSLVSIGQTGLRTDVPGVLCNLGRVLQLSGKVQEGLEKLRESVSLLEGLLSEGYGNVESNLGVALANLGNGLILSGDKEGGLQVLQKGERLLQEVVDRGDRQSRFDLAKTKTFLGLAQIARGDFTGAIAKLSESSSLFQLLDKEGRADAKLELDAVRKYIGQAMQAKARQP